MLIDVLELTRAVLIVNCTEVAPAGTRRVDCRLGCPPSV